MATTRSKAAVRYNLLAILFFLFLLACGASFFWELFTTSVPADRLLVAASESQKINSLAHLFQDFLHFYAAHTFYIVILWSLLFCAKAAHLTGAFAYNHRLQQQRLPITDPHWNTTFQQLTIRLGVRQEVAFFESAVLHIPVVIGHLKPLIFLPAGVLTRLSPAEVEAVLLHELAHIMRKDYLVNLFQLGAESIFFFNPALLWMSALLREVREHCCDDMAIATTNNKKEFIQALVSFREVAAVPTRYEVAFPAAKNQLLKRVSRIIYQRNSNLDTAGKTFFVASLLLLGLIIKAATHAVAVPEVKMFTAAIGEPVVARTPLQVDVDVRSSARELVQDLKPMRKVIRTHSKTVLSLTGINNREIAGDKPNASQAVEVAFIGPNDEKKESAHQYDGDRLRMTGEPNRQLIDQRRAQVLLDRLQADKDREQAMKDREQVASDRVQAENDRRQAAEDRQRMQSERTRFIKERTQIVSRTIIDI
jgi:beta-lactamase regulating signal transducer with metallopeptidase domain